MPITLNRKLAMLRKYHNFLRTEGAFISRKEHLTTYPYHAFIDPSTTCNLRCPFCTVGKGESKQPKRLMPFSDFKRVMDMVGNYLFQVEIYQYGEPLLNPDIYRMIEYAKKYHTFTRISSNLNIFNKEKAWQLVESGLDYLTLSIDGASQGTYSVYRVGGDFERVIENVRHLVEAKKALNSQTPHLVWQFLLFRHNEHEVEKAREMSQKLGLDVFFLIPGYIPAEKTDWVPTDAAKKRYGFLAPPPPEYQPPTQTAMEKKLNVCKWLWTHLIVSSNGIVSPCCRRSVSEPEFGNIFEAENFMDLWNSPGFRSTRRFFTTGTKQTPPTLCETCPIENRDIVPLASKRARTLAEHYRSARQFFS